MTVLITGGTGFLGANLARALVKEGIKIVLFESNPNMKIVDDFIDKVELIRGDVANWAEVMNIVKTYNIQKIFHTAALLSDNAEKYPLRAYQVNSTGTWNVLEAARLFEVKQVIFTSTNGTYGDHIGPIVSNDAPQFPRILYGATKIAGERMGEYYFYRFGLDFRGLRFPSVIGPGRGGGGVSAYTTLSVQLAALGKPYDIYVAPESYAPLLYVEDAVKAMIGLSKAQRDKLTRCMYSMKGVRCNAEELVSEIKKIIPEAQLNFVPDPAITDIVNKIPTMDDSLARQDWGFESDYNELPIMVQRFIEQVQADPDKYY